MIVESLISEIAKKCGLDQRQVSILTEKSCFISHPHYYKKIVKIILVIYTNKAAQYFVQRSNIHSHSKSSSIFSLA